MGARNSFYSHPFIFICIVSSLTIAGAVKFYACLASFQKQRKHFDSLCIVFSLISMIFVVRIGGDVFLLFFFPFIYESVGYYDNYFTLSGFRYKFCNIHNKFCDYKACSGFNILFCMKYTRRHKLNYIVSRRRVVAFYVFDFFEHNIAYKQRSPRRCRQGLTYRNGAQFDTNRMILLIIGHVYERTFSCCASSA